MILQIISKRDMEKLRKAGLIKEKTKNQDPNYYVANKQHTKAKTYYIVEEYKIMVFLGYKKDKNK